MGDKTLTDIACTVRMIRDKAIAVADGTMEQHEGREREKFYWLPKSMIEVDPDDYDVGDAVTGTMPEWKAMDVGLI